MPRVFSPGSRLAPPRLVQRPAPNSRQRARTSCSHALPLDMCGAGVRSASLLVRRRLRAAHPEPEGAPSCKGNASCDKRSPDVRRDEPADDCAKERHRTRDRIAEQHPTSLSRRRRSSEEHGSNDTRDAAHRSEHESGGGPTFGEVTKPQPEDSEFSCRPPEGRGDDYGHRLHVRSPPACVRANVCARAARNQLTARGAGRAPVVAVSNGPPDDGPPCDALSTRQVTTSSFAATLWRGEWTQLDPIRIGPKGAWAVDSSHASTPGACLEPSLRTWLRSDAVQG